MMIFIMLSSTLIYSQDQFALTVTSDKPEFILKLKSNPTTGYSWFLTKYNPSVVKLVRHYFEAPMNKKRVGAPGYELWIFRVKPAGFIIPQHTFIHFVYKRPWESASDVERLTFNIVTVSK